MFGIYNRYMFVYLTLLYLHLAVYLLSALCESTLLSAKFFVGVYFSENTLNRWRHDSAPEITRVSMCAAESREHIESDTWHWCTYLNISFALKSLWFPFVQTQWFIYRLVIVSSTKRLPTAKNSTTGLGLANSPEMTYRRYFDAT